MKRRKVLYIEIAQQIKEDIFQGKYPVGTMLPTETEFENLFDVSKITIRKAIELLAIDGFVKKQSGKGTEVVSNRLFNFLSKGDSFSSILEKNGVKIEKTVLSIETLTDLSKLKYPQLPVQVRRIYYYENEPYILFTYYLPAAMHEITKAELESQSLYTLLAKKGYVVDKFLDAFEVATLDAFQQSILKIENTPVLQRQRQSIDYTGKVIEYSEAVYNTKIHSYLIEFNI